MVEIAGSPSSVLFFFFWLCGKFAALFLEFLRDNFNFYLHNMQGEGGNWHPHKILNYIYDFLRVVPFSHFSIAKILILFAFLSFSHCFGFYFYAAFIALFSAGAVVLCMCLFWNGMCWRKCHGKWKWSHFSVGLGT